MKVEFVERLSISEISRGIGVVRVEKGATGNQKVYLHSKSHQLLAAINDKRNNGSFLGSTIDFPSVASLLSFVNSNQKLGRLELQEANKIDYETGHLKQQFVWWSGKSVDHFDVATTCLEVTQSRKYFREGYIPWN